MYKQEALDALECFRRNTAHILGDNDEKVKTIETCMMLVREAEEASEWISVTEGLPKLTTPVDEMVSSDFVLCIDSHGEPATCALWDDGSFCDGYGNRRDVVKWMPIPGGGKG